MKPLEGAQAVVTRNHVAVAHVVTEAISGFSCLLAGAFNLVVGRGGWHLLMARGVLPECEAALLVASLVTGLVDRAKGAQQLRIQLVGNRVNQRTLAFFEFLPTMQW